MEIKVKDMTCNHCVMKIDKALMMAGVKGKADLESKTVNVKLEKDLDKAKEAITNAGYTIEG